MMGRVSLIAHRGQPLSFPENSLQGFKHAAEAGASYVETDVHVSVDGIPVLSHDANLLKLTGKQIIIADHSFAAMAEMSAGYPERFGDQFEDYRIASLQQFSELMQQYPEIICFIELKESSLDYWGNKAVDLTLQAIEDIKNQCVLISFDHDALLYAKQNYSIPIGWVLPEWTEENHKTAIELKPRYLFVDAEFCPREPTDLWPGRWEWAAYTINSAEEVDHFAGLGIELIETDRYSDLIKESKIVEVSNDF